MRHLLKVTYLLAATLMLSLWPHGVRLAVAQENEVRYDDRTARKFDEFGDVGSCDHGARLDNFAIALENEPTATGYIITYGPAGEGAGTGELRLQITGDYLVNTRGVDPFRFKSIYGGRYREISGSATELWIAPLGADPPKPQNYGNAAATFSGRLAEFNTNDELYAEYEDAGLGPGFGTTPMAGLADILKQQPDKLVYVVAYNSSKAAPGAWRRASRETASTIERKLGIKGDRIKVIYGGYRQLKDKYASARVELWVADADAEPPVAEVKESEPRPEKAVQITSIDEQTAAYGDNSKLAFEGFAEILKNDREMKACIIIRLEAETKETEEVEAAEIGDETAEGTMVIGEALAAAVEATPKQDLIQLIEKWKSDLEEKYGISRDRLLVIMGTAREYQPTTLETWVVPPGVALPDPNVVEEDETLSEEEMSKAQQNPQ